MTDTGVPPAAFGAAWPAADPGKRKEEHSLIHTYIFSHSFKYYKYFLRITILMDSGFNIISSSLQGLISPILYALVNINL